MVSSSISRGRGLFAASLLLWPTLWQAMNCSSAPAAEDDSPAPSSAELPRYHFEVGQELVYEKTLSEDLLHGADDEQRDKTRSDRQLKWWLWVVRQNDDGGWRLLIRKHIKNTDFPAEGEPKVSFENDFLGYCDLQPDGSFTENSTLGSHPYFKIHPEELFVRLPADDNAFHNGWEYSEPLNAGQYSLHAEEAAGDHLTFAGTVVLPDDINYESHNTRQIDFDGRRGLVTRIAGESKADWSVSPWHTRYAYSLLSVEYRDPQWLAKFSDEADRYFAVMDKWWELTREAARAHSKEACQTILDSLRLTIVGGRKRAELTETQELFDALLVLHDREAAWALDSAAAREELYAKPSLAWETTELDGTPRRLADYRGKVVLMDFWYRGCGHCIEALPKVKELAAKYGDKNVVVLGINNDREDANAQYVIDAFELRYPVLRASDIPKQYFVDTWPTFIVLDQNGRIAEFVEGNADDLVECLSTVVDQLLANPPQDAELQAASVPAPESP